jgi:hypothetical protein
MYLAIVLHYYFLCLELYPLSVFKVSRLKSLKRYYVSKKDLSVAAQQYFGFLIFLRL